MHRRAALLLALCFAIALLPGSATAAERVALVVGNAKYQHGAALKNAARDAEAMAGLLRNVGFGSVAVEIDANRQKMLDTLRTFGDEAGKADWAVVFFAGHGVEIDGTNYLVPVDARLANVQDVKDGAITLQQVLDGVVPKKLRLVILDAARDNPFARTMRPSIGTRQSGTGVGFSGPSTLIAYATKAGEVAQEGDGENSPFTAALLKNLPTPGLISVSCSTACAMT
jgi:uncharacterized caspase-like protein